MTRVADDPQARLDELCAVLGPCRPSGDRLGLRCPSHDDKHASLTARIGDEGHILLKCHVGCGFAEIEAAAVAAGLDRSVLYPPGNRTPTIERQYPYTDADGTVLGYKCRLLKGGRSGRFAWRGADGSWGLNGVSVGLYRLPAVLKAVAAGETIVVTEGERDADAAAALGLCATTSPFGADRKGVKWRDEWTQLLAGANVALIADHDDTGHRYAIIVGEKLTDAGCTVTLLRPPEPGHDLSDHLAAGHGLDELEPLTDAPKPRRLKEGRWPFVLFPTEIALDPKVTDAGIRAYVVLEDHQNRTGEPFQGRNHLAQVLGWSIGKTFDATKNLADCKWIEIETEGAKRHRYRVRNPARDPAVARAIDKETLVAQPTTTGRSADHPPKTLVAQPSTAVLLAGLRSGLPLTQAEAETKVAQWFGDVVNVAQ